MKETDQYFDGIADKFARNIYGTTKGRLRHILLLEAMQPFLTQPQRIIEIGGGTGIMTKALAEQGHQITLTDASGDVLALAAELLASFSQVEQQHAPLRSLTTIDQYDLVVCHAVLEWLAEPFEAIDYLFEQMAPGSRLSLSFFNRDAALFSNALYGNFDYIAKGLRVKNQVRLNPTNALRPADVLAHLSGLGFTVLSRSGIRCFHDYMKDKPVDDGKFAELLALEREYRSTEPFCWLGKYFHVMVQKPG